MARVKTQKEVRETDFFKELLEKARELDEEHLRTLNRQIVAKLRSIKNEKIMAVKPTLKIGAQVKLSERNEKALRLGIKEGTVIDIMVKRAVVEFNGTRYKVPIQMLQVV
jgi:hypothetical protein